MIKWLKSLFRGSPSIDDYNLSEEDKEILQQKPISRKRMVLTWGETDLLAQLKGALASTDTVVIGMDDGSGRPPQPYEITRNDLEWASEVYVVIDHAAERAQSGDFRKAIQLYKAALKLAPGCDMFLMSIGSCYANLGDRKTAKCYLQRAAEISPHNDRIRKNLKAL
jgi:tetratricopeptide (TPR) repeat protein